MKLHLGLALGGILGLSPWGIGGLVRADEGPIADVDYLAQAITRSASAARASSLALTRAKGKAVQQFARQIIGQQGAFDLALNTLARDHDVPVLFNQVRGRELGESRLATLRGDPFDREFLRLLSKDLGQWIDLSQRFTTGPGAGAARELASKMLPGLGQQLQDANRLLKTVR